VGLPCGFGGWVMIAAPRSVRYKQLGLWTEAADLRSQKWSCLSSVCKHHGCGHSLEQSAGFFKCFDFICYLSVSPSRFPALSPNPFPSVTNPTQLAPSTPKYISLCSNIKHFNPVHGIRCVVIRSQQVVSQARLVPLSYPLPAPYAPGCAPSKRAKT
jgi:hypothetical protein